MSTTRNNSCHKKQVGKYVFVGNFLLHFFAECSDSITANGLALADVPAFVIRQLKFITNVQ
jgi:hypothetical protein